MRLLRIGYTSEKEHGVESAESVHWTYMAFITCSSTKKSNVYTSRPKHLLTNDNLTTIC